MTEAFRTRVREILHLHESPHRTALAFAVGVIIAFSPTYGLHTVSVLFCAWAFRLNFLAVAAGSFINNPWSFVPILGLTLWTGFVVTGQTPVTMAWDNVSLGAVYEQVMPYLLPFFVGGFILSAIGALVSYPVAYVVIARYRAGLKQRPSGQQPLPPGTEVG